MKKYNIGDIIKTIDGIGYNGDSLTYKPAWISEILDIDHNGYLVKDYYGSKSHINQDEIEKRLYTNFQKLNKFKEQIQHINQIGWLISKNSGNIEKVKIVDFCFGRLNYIIKTLTYRGCPFEYDKLLFNETEAYRFAYNIGNKKLKEIYKIFKEI